MQHLENTKEFYDLKLSKKEDLSLRLIKIICLDKFIFESLCELWGQVLHNKFNL